MGGKYIGDLEGLAVAPTLLLAYAMTKAGLGLKLRLTVPGNKRTPRIG